MVLNINVTLLFELLSFEHLIICVLNNVHEPK